jgi:hypothetical protein
MFGMRLLPRFGCCEGSAEAAGEACGPQDGDGAEVAGESMRSTESNFLKTIGWVSAALGAVALGLIVGRELRQRYKFNRRTPYDLYSHSGDELPDVDFGVGI